MAKWSVHYTQILWNGMKSFDWSPRKFYWLQKTKKDWRRSLCNKKKHQGKDKKENVSNNVWQNWSTIVKSTKSNVSIYVVYWMFSSFKPKVKWRTTSTNYLASYLINYINAEEATKREQQLYLVLRYSKTYFSKSILIKNQR